MKSLEVNLVTTKGTDRIVYGSSLGLGEIPNIYRMLLDMLLDNVDKTNTSIGYTDGRLYRTFTDEMLRKMSKDMWSVWESYTVEENVTKVIDSNVYSDDFEHSELHVLSTINMFKKIIDSKDDFLVLIIESKI